jgi:dihydrofolate synthase/folylpolyglutamate synthase
MKPKVKQILAKHKSYPTLYNAKSIISFVKNFQFDQFFKPHILVGGTNGKGSVTRILSKIYQTAGYKVGTFLTPHLLKFNERILVNDKEITNSEFGEMYNKLSPLLYKQMVHSNLRITPFELYLLGAILWFYTNDCDICIYEVGLGGKRDATACLEPELSILTNVDKDHLHILGSSIEEIAQEKSGVIRKNKTFLWAGSCDLNEYFELRCEEKNSVFSTHQKLVSNYKTKLNGGTGQIQMNDSTVDFYCPLVGTFQEPNINTALNAVSILNQKFPISNKQICTALSQTEHSCRMQKINSNPIVFIDGTHNVLGFKELSNLLYRYNTSDIRLYLSIKQNKEHHEISQLLKPFKVVGFTGAGPKMMTQNMLKKSYKIDSFATSCKSIYEHIIKEPDKLHIITGSLYSSARLKAPLLGYLKQ